MTSFIPDRDFAFAILKEYTRNESLIRHALTAEAVMGYFAELFCEKEVEAKELCIRCEPASDYRRRKNAWDGAGCAY